MIRGFAPLFAAFLLVLRVHSQTPDSSSLPCTSPPIVANANHTDASTAPGSVVTYTCLPGYATSGSRQKTCRDGRWVSSGPSLSCQVVYCPRPNSISSGNFRSLGSSRYTEGVRVTYYCYNGYDFNGTSPEITCLANATWTTLQGICAKKDCGPPPEIAGGNVSYTTTDYYSGADYRCLDGYSLYNNGYRRSSNSYTLRCQSSGLWPLAPTCKPMDCGLPRNIANAVRLSRGNHLYGQEVAYQCDHGYRPVANSSVICLATGVWSPYPECIKVSCAAPPVVANATNTVVGKAEYGAKVTYECGKGFDLHGSNHVTCLSDGTWSDPPECIILDCRTPPAIHYGKHSWSSTTYNSVAEYSCDEGYTLIGVPQIHCKEDGQWRDAPTCELPPGKGSASARKSSSNNSAMTGLAIACALFGVVTLLCVIGLGYKLFCEGRKGRLFSYASYKNGDDTINGI